MAADIGIDATTSLDEAFAAAMERHGPDAKVIVLPYARYQLPREHGADGRRRRCGIRRRRWRTDAARRSGARRARHVRGGAGVAGDQGLDDDRRAPAHVSRTARPRGSSRALQMPCAHCGGAFHEPLTMAAKRHRRDPRAVLEAFRALESGGPDRGGVAAALARVAA